MSKGRAVAVAAVLGLLAGCSSGGSRTAAPAGLTTTTTTGPAPCPAAALPAGATDSTTVGGDYDGDGRPDRLQAYRAAAAGPWRLRVELGAGGAVETELPATAEGVRPLGGVRLGPDQAQTAVVVVGTNAPGVNLGLFGLAACRLERVTVGGAPTELPVRHTDTERDGLACQPPGLVVYKATSTDGRFFQASTVGYLLIGSTLDEADRSLSPLGADDPLLDRFDAFSCGGLRL
ncbi:MAG: hypothetical protein M3066_02320 [Actinomycetota bacterium]|nr:hypothetical protein [Actinomycetota bacterium]